MLLVFKVLAVLYVLLGFFFIAKPTRLRNYILFWSTKKRLYAGGGFAAIFGIILLMNAPQAHWPLFIQLMGAAAIIKGVLIYALGTDRMMPILNWYDQKPDRVMRFIGVLAAVIGALFFLAI